MSSSSSPSCPPGRRQFWYGFRSLIPVDLIKNDVSLADMDNIGLISDMCHQLDMDFTVFPTSAILYHRFCGSAHSDNQNLQMVAYCCVFLSAKLAEDPRPLRDIINLSTILVGCKTTTTNEMYWKTKAQLIDLEQLILRVLHFDVEIQLPYAFLFNYCRSLRCGGPFVQLAMHFVHDIYYIPQCLQYPPYVIAVASIYMAQRIHKHVSLPPAWHHAFDTSEADLDAIVELFCIVYSTLDKKKRRRASASACSQGDEQHVDSR